MKPVKFRGANKVYGEGQPEYQPLPVQKDGDQVTSVWELSDEEVEEIVRTKRIKITQVNFNQPLQPILPETFKEYELY